MRILGIRHHGPGSAKNINSFLLENEPDAIFIELPENLEQLVNTMDLEGIEPPFAFISFNKKQPSQHLYLPFAEFSPEWQAIKYARDNYIPIKCIDMKTGYFFDIYENEQGHYYDEKPLGLFAKLSGYKDIESWWEHTFEIYNQSEIVFDLILELMREFRDDIHANISEETRVREAFMRSMLVRYGKKFSNPVCICGAYHTAALEQLDKSILSTDEHLIKSLPSPIKTDERIIPWSYQRMAKSNYQSGANSPAWYESLYHQEENMHLDWLARAAQLLRKNDYPVSPAHLIDSSQLLQQILIIRDRAYPSLNDILDVIKTNLCQGKQEIYELIESDLLIGNKIGSIKSEQHTHPIVDDFNRLSKKARIKSYIDKNEAYLKNLDLRKELHQEISQFFYQLLILKIDCVEIQEKIQQTTSTFAEQWLVSWEDDHMIQLVKAGLYGHTIKEAAEFYSINQANAHSDLSTLLNFLMLSMRAKLNSVDIILEHLYKSAFHSQDLFEIMQLAIDLMPLRIYGSIYEFDQNTIDSVILYCFKKVISGLNSLYNGIDNDTAVKEKERFILFQSAIIKFNDHDISRLWNHAIIQLYHNQSAHVLIQGILTRFMIDKNNLSQEEIKTQLLYHTSTPYTPLESSLWIEGLISGNGYRILRNKSLLKPLDIWMNQLLPDEFMQLLPVLRRSFSAMNAQERTALFGKIQNFYFSYESKEEKSKDMTTSPSNLEFPDVYRQLLDE